MRQCGWQTFTEVQVLTRHDLYPGMRACPIILLPVSTAMAESYFSAMHRIETYLSSTVTTDPLSGLGLLKNIHREREINIEKVTDVFARCKPMKNGVTVSGI